MEYIKGIPLFYLYKNKLINPSHIDKLFSVLHQIHNCDIKITITDQNIKNNYIKKIQDRYNKNDYFFEDSDEIFKCIINKLETHYNPTLAGVIHGDFWFSNIILDYDDNIKLIDMKGQVDGILSLNGDIYYDYGKLLQSVLGYDLIINDCIIDDDYITFIQEYFFQKCKEIQLDIEFLKVVTLSFLF